MLSIAPRSSPSNLLPSEDSGREPFTSYLPTPGQCSPTPPLLSELPASPCPSAPFCNVFPTTHTSSVTACDPREPGRLLPRG